MNMCYHYYYYMYIYIYIHIYTYIIMVIIICTSIIMSVCYILVRYQEGGGWRMGLTRGGVRNILQRLSANANKES